MNKTILTIILTALVAAAVPAQELTLDQALRDAAAYITENIPTGSKVAILNVESDNPQLSAYIIDELSTILVNGRSLDLVDRHDLDLIRQEEQFQLSGEVSDESAQDIGHKLGAQTIISGSLIVIGNMSRLRIKALEVLTGRVQGMQNYTIKRGKTTGEKIAAGAQNLFFGLGSYIDGDLSGALTLTAGYAAAAGLFIVEAAALDWDSPAVGVPATIGVCVAGLSAVYGFARPFIYHHDRQVAAFLDNVKADIVPVSDKDNGAVKGALRLSYSWKF